MNYLSQIKISLAKNLNKILAQALVEPEMIVSPPDAKMGDLSLPCFGLAKPLQKNPVQIAAELSQNLILDNFLLSAKAIGPYLNFYLKPSVLAANILTEVQSQGVKYGQVNFGKKQKILLEFAEPNTHKAFHIGHLRGTITGESLARILENAGFQVFRANYQGDVGPHVAKCLWGILSLKPEYNKVINKNLENKINFLAKSYVLGSKNYEESSEIKQEITKLNQEIYGFYSEKNSAKSELKNIYFTTRDWSLDYFEKIYAKLGTRFDRLYFESEVFEDGRKIVLKNLAKNIFKKSQGAVIFPGAQYGLHDRVFLNSQGYPTYEAKELALALLQSKEYKPKKIIHIVGSEQSEYFKVIFSALEKIKPGGADKELHLPYALVDLKQGKMSSRLGNVILGEWLLAEIEKEILAIMAESKIKNKIKIAEKVSLAAVKYSILKNGINKKISFDIKESISLSGASGPYLQYAFARIKSIINKSKLDNKKVKINFALLTEQKEHNLILKISEYPESALKAAQSYDPAIVARYLLELAQLFNDYYHEISILKAEAKIQSARLALISAIAQIIQNGLYLLSIETVDEM